MSYPVKRAIGHPDPRMIVQSGYGGFEYMKVTTGTQNGDYAVWIFDSEAGRAKFIKDYGGAAGGITEDWVPVYYQPAYKDAIKQQAQSVGCYDVPGDAPLDPDCDLSTYCVEWAPGVWGLSFELGGRK